MKNSIPTLLILGLTASSVLLAGAERSQAALISYDGFDVPGTYPAFGSIAGLGGGSGWTGNYNQTGSFSFIGSTTGLTFGDLLTTPGAAIAPLDGNVFNFTANTRTFTPISSGQLWVSWLYSPNPSIYSGLGLSRTGGGEAFYIGTDGNGLLRIDTTAAGGSNGTYGALTAGTTFVVAHLDYTAQTINVYRDPTPGAALPSATASFSGLNIGEVQSLIFLSGANGVTSFDEFRLGSSFVDVTPVPEPSSLIIAALGVAGLAFASLRKKKLGA